MNCKMESSPSPLTISKQKLSSFQRQKHDLIVIFENFNVYNRFIYLLDGKIMQKKFTSYAL